MSGEGKLNVVGYGKLFVKPDYTKLFFKMNDLILMMKKWKE